MNERGDRSADPADPPVNDPNAESDAPEIEIDVDPNDKRLDNVEESVERAGW